MTRPQSLPAPRVMSASDFEAALDAKVAKQRASEEADALLADAQAEAQRIIAAAEAEAEELREGIAKISEQELEKFVNTRALDEVADSLVAILNESARLRADFNGLKPWLSDLLRTSLDRVLNEMPERLRIESALTQTMNEVRERWDLILRCHPDLAPMFKEVIGARRELSGAIKEVQVDRDLTAQDCFLIGHQGILDISIATQVDALVRALEKMIADDTLGDTAA
ncbi:MAG: hypothetical protein AAF943_17950 [Pseudomonadota bacterium]